MTKKLSTYLDSTQELLSKFSGTNDLELHKNFLIEQSFRSYDILVSIENLLSSNLKETDLEHPIGILLRSGLYDFINFQYLANSSLIKNRIDEVIFEKMVREHMSSHYNYIDPKMPLKDELKELDRFSEYGKKSKFKTLGISKEGLEFAKSKKLNYLEEAISIWEWYSKYEHYGVFTNIMYQKIEDNRSRRYTGIQLLMANIYLSLTTLVDLGTSIIDLQEVQRLEIFVLNYNKNKC